MLTRRAAILGGFSVPLAPIRLGQRTLPWQTRLAFAARSQIGITRMYDPAYAHLSYPMGDVERSRGVCTDVIVRAYRDAFAMDLQQLVHEDMTNAFSKYPTIWGLTRPDRNIDHRRVPNLEKYIERHGLALSTPPDDTGWKAGDLYTMRYKESLPHIGIVSDKTTRTGRPLIIHNMGWGTSEDDIIGQFQHERRFRLAPRPAA
jgi:uncharacterized protein